MSRFISVAALAATFTSTIYAQSVDKVIVRVPMREAGLKAKDFPPDLDIAGQNLREGTLDIVVDAEQYSVLREFGVPLQIVEHQPLGISSDYLQYSEIVQFIQEMAEQYPDIIRVIEIGRSNQNRPIYAIRVSTHENADIKPAVLFNGMHHAREIMTTEVTTDIIRFLTTNYQNPDMPAVTAWVENVAIWVIPQLNPDGNEIVWTKDNWWRKNGRGDDDSVWGVDLNRNYSFQWNACGGSSGSRGSDTYRGESPGSEPETQAMMRFYKEQNIAMSISYHSYSEMVVAPYGCQGQYAPENFILKDVGLNLARKIPTDDARGTYAYGTGWELLYPVDGEDISWMYNEVNSIAYVIEINSSRQGFQPDYRKWRDGTVERNRLGWQYILNRMMAGPQIRGQIRNAVTGERVDGTIKILGLNYTNEKFRRSRNGVYYKVMAPGSFEIEFSAPGYQSQVIPVTIGGEGIMLDVELQPNSHLDWDGYEWH